MSNLISGNQKHLTFKDRLYMKQALDKQTSFKDIACFLCKDPITISKEVRAHCVSESGMFLCQDLVYNVKET